MAKTIRKAHISGLGAVGSVYASILYGYDRESVKVIVDAERASRYQAQGATVNGKKYDFDYVISQTPAEPADLILIAVKGNQLEESIESIRPFVGENTILMSLLNGISSEDILAGEFGDAHILHASWWVLMPSGRGWTPGTAIKVKLFSATGTRLIQPMYRQ